MAWDFVLTDAHHRPVGELLNAGDQTVALPLNKLDTMSCKVRADNPLADTLLTCQGYIKGYHNGVHAYHGPIISAEETGDANGASIAINSVGAGWILTKRLAGKSSTGTVFSAATDRAQVIKQLIDAANTEGAAWDSLWPGAAAGAYTGIDTSGPMSAASAVTYTAGPFRPISEIVTELASTLDGFDWRILPVDNYASGAVTGPNIGQFLAQPVLGTSQPNVVFEYGAGRNNIASYTRTVSRETQADRVFHFTSNGPDAFGYPTVSAIDYQTISDWGLLEDLAQADLLDLGLRNALVQQHVNIRKLPRQLIQFTPHIDPDDTGRVPQFGSDYTVGDSVRGRAVYAGNVRFDALLRIWGVQFETDNNGVEKTTLTLADEGG